MTASPPTPSDPPRTDEAAVRAVYDRLMAGWNEGSAATPDRYESAENTLSAYEIETY